MITPAYHCPPPAYIRAAQQHGFCHSFLSTYQLDPKFIIIVIIYQLVTCTKWHTSDVLTVLWNNNGHRMHVIVKSPKL